MWVANPWKFVTVRLEVQTWKGSSKHLKPRKHPQQAEIKQISNSSWTLSNEEDKVDRELVEMYHSTCT